MQQRIPLGALMLLAALPSHGHAAMHRFLAVDVPSRLDGTDYAASQIVRSNDDGTYALWSALPPDEAVAALHVLGPDRYLVALRAAAEIGGTTYESRDVLLRSGGAVSSYFDGSAGGLGPDAAIDAIMLAPSGELVLSFDAPATAGGATYLPSDLVLWSGSGFGLYWSGAAWGAPPGANLVGASAAEDGSLVVSFDIPVTFGASTFVPGDLISAGPAVGQFQLYARDALWPSDARVSDFSFPASPGAVPDGLSGTPLTATKAGGDVRLAWGTGCEPLAQYAVYEGTLGSWYSHSARACSVPGTTHDVAPAPGSTYYLVVPLTDVEGSYGESSAGERPVGLTACAPRWLGGCP